MPETRTASVDLVTLAGLALCMTPLLTAWHELAGHGSVCIALGGRLTALSAFYVNCESLGPWETRAVACAGGTADAALSLAAWSLLQRPGLRDTMRLILFYAFVVKAFAAAGYLIFSGLTGLGDFGTERDAALSDVSYQLVWRFVFIFTGAAAYILVFFAASRRLTVMVGGASAGRLARRRIAHTYYFVSGVDAVLVGLMNPLGMSITLLSAGASSLGAGIGLISLGFAARGADTGTEFRILRRWSILLSGLALSVGFAATLGRTIDLG